MEMLIPELQMERFEYVYYSFLHTYKVDILPHMCGYLHVNYSCIHFIF